MSWRPDSRIRTATSTTLQKSKRPTHPLTPAQRNLLRAFVDTDEAAGAIAGNALWFRAAGQPANREGIVALL